MPKDSKTGKLSMSGTTTMKTRGSVVKPVVKSATILMAFGLIGYLLSPFYERFAAEVLYPLFMEWIKR